MLSEISDIVEWSLIDLVAYFASVENVDFFTRRYCPHSFAGKEIQGSTLAFYFSFCIIKDLGLNYFKFGCFTYQPKSFFLESNSVVQAQALL